MKPLHQFLNTDKGMLLFELFPEHMPGLLQYIKGMSETIQDDHVRVRDAWQPNGLFTFETWLSLAEQAGKRIDKHGAKLHKNKRLFCDQLFDGYIAIFTCHCITTYTKTRKHQEPKFTLAVDLLFNP